MNSDLETLIARRYDTSDDLYEMIVGLLTTEHNEQVLKDFGVHGDAFACINIYPEHQSTWETKFVNNNLQGSTWNGNDFEKLDEAFMLCKMWNENNASYPEAIYLSLEDGSMTVGMQFA